MKKIIIYIGLLLMIHRSEAYNYNRLINDRTPAVKISSVKLDVTKKSKVEMLFIHRAKNTFETRYGNWNNEEIAFNLLQNENSDSVCVFNEISAALEYLKENMTQPTVVNLIDGFYEINSTIIVDLPYPIIFEGDCKGESVIYMEQDFTGSTFFDCRSECCFKYLSFYSCQQSDCSNAILFSNKSQCLEVTDCIFNGFNRALCIKDCRELMVTKSDFLYCKEKAIQFLADFTGSAYVAECLFSDCHTGVCSEKIKSETIKIENCMFNKASYNNMEINSGKSFSLFTEY